MYTKVGACPKCGAPVYAPILWGSILPPPSTTSCNCNASNQVKVVWSTGTIAAPGQAEVEDAANE